jgi:hypothetical protein
MFTIYNFLGVAAMRERQKCFFVAYNLPILKLQKNTLAQSLSTRLAYQHSERWLQHIILLLDGNHYIPSTQY